MAFVSSDVSLRKPAMTVGELGQPENAFSLPDLLRCMVYTWSDERAELLNSIAESELWKTTTRLEASEFLRDLFRLQFPLVFADMPREGVDPYPAMKHAVACAADGGSSQLVICGRGTNAVEEIWARELGAWAYLPGVNVPCGLEQVFRDARKSIANQATKYVELAALR